MFLSFLDRSESDLKFVHLNLFYLLSFFLNKNTHLGFSLISDTKQREINTNFNIETVWKTISTNISVKIGSTQYALGVQYTLKGLEQILL